jgi:hypothetical protein
MARTGLGLSIDELAQVTGLTIMDIEAFEADQPCPVATPFLLHAAFEERGVEILTGHDRGVALYIRTDTRQRPEIICSPKLRYTSPEAHLYPRWVGDGIITWDGMTLGSISGAGDAVKATVMAVPGSVGPLYFDNPNDACTFLAEVLVEQDLPTKPGLPEATDLVARYLQRHNRSETKVEILGLDVVDSRAEFSIRLTPAPELADDLSPDVFSREPMGLEAACDWLDEANMYAYLHRNAQSLARMISSDPDDEFDA